MTERERQDQAEMARLRAEQARALIEAAFVAMRPPQRRTMLEFAEQEYTVPDGPRKGLRFSTEFMPWNALALQALLDPRWRRHFGVGPPQSGKTLLFFQMPLLYWLFEHGEGIVLGVPEDDLAMDIWRERAVPAIECTRYREYLARTGQGSKGGRTKVIRLRNGATVRFMSATGSDARRSSYSARIVILTELDKIDRVRQSGPETTARRQIEHRAYAYGASAQIYGESTPSDPQGAVWQEAMVAGTGTRIHLRCPHCRRWVPILRDHLLGHQESENVLQAREAAFYGCPHCGAAWREGDRAAALREPRFVARGQAVDEQGVVTGPLPPTDTFGLHWSAFLSAMWTMADLGEREYKARSSESDEDEKNVVQSVWGEPWEGDRIEETNLTANGIRSRAVAVPRGRVPATATKLVVATDIGKRMCNWVCVAWHDDATAHVVDYGVIEVPEGQQGEEASLLAALRDWRDQVLLPGWQDTAGKQRLPDQVGVDAGYLDKVIYQFCLESGQVTFKPTKGFGSARHQQIYSAPNRSDNKTVPGNDWYLRLQPAGVWLLCLDADAWKLYAHQRLLAPLGQPGAMTLFAGEKLTHLSFAKHITSEKRVEEFKPGIGRVVRWERTSANNHWLDALAINCACADLVGVKVLPPVQMPSQPPARTEAERTRPRETEPRRRKKEDDWIGGGDNWV